MEDCQWAGCTNKANQALGLVRRCTHDQKEIVSCGECADKHLEVGYASRSTPCPYCGVVSRIMVHWVEDLKVDS